MAALPSSAARRALTLILLCAGLAPRPARAHQQSLSFGELRVRGARIEGRLRFSAADLLPLLQLAPAGDQNVQLTQRDLERAGPALAKATIGELRLRSSGEDCVGAPGGTTLEDEDGVLIAGTWTCPGPVTDLEVRVGFLDLIAPGHTHLAKIVFDDGEPGDVAQRIAQQGAETFSVGRARSTGSTALRFLRLGVLHIFTGYDHVAFLIGLLLLGGSFRTLVKIVTSFTLAHSITLALAALDILAPPPRLIEPLIAASSGALGNLAFMSRRTAVAEPLLKRARPRRPTARPRNLRRQQQRPRQSLRFDRTSGRSRVRLRRSGNQRRSGA